MQHEDLVVPPYRSVSARAAHVREASLEFAKSALRVLVRTAKTEARYASNDEGHLAWDVAPALRAACMLWRLEGDDVYLRYAVSLATHLYTSTDEARKTKDWTGRSRSVWSAGRRYTAGSADIGMVSGRRLRFLSASEGAVMVERPSDETVVVSIVTNGETVWRSREASVHAGRPDYLPDLLAERSSVASPLMHGLTEPVCLDDLPAGTFPIVEQRAPHLLHTGGIARALLDAAACVRNAPEERDRNRTERFRTTALRALTAHDGELEVHEQHAWYVTPLDFPGRRLGLPLPHNHVADAATAQVLLARLPGEQHRREIGVKLMRPFIQEVRRAITGELEHPWHYYPVGTGVYTGTRRRDPVAERVIPSVSVAEDSSHATLRVRAIAEWHDLVPDEVPPAVLTEVARSLPESFLTRRNGTPTLRWFPASDAPEARKGLADTYPGAWAALRDWEPTLKRRLNELTAHHPPSAVFGAAILSAAELVALNSSPARARNAWRGRTAPT